MHHPKAILNACRTTHMPVEPPADEGAEPEDPEKKDPYEQRLKPITSDAPVKDMKGAWVLKIKGD